MQLGLGLLRLSPQTFWAMTLRELEAAASGALGPTSLPTPLARRDFTALTKRFPDNEGG